MVLDFIIFVRKKYKKTVTHTPSSELKRALATPELLLSQKQIRVIRDAKRKGILKADQDHVRGAAGASFIHKARRMADERKVAERKVRKNSQK